MQAHLPSDGNMKVDEVEEGSLVLGLDGTECEEFVAQVEVNGLVADEQ